MHHDSSKSTGTSLPTTCPSLPTTCPSLPYTTSPPLPGTCPSLTTDDDFIHQDLNKTASASIFTNTMVCIENSCLNQVKSHEQEPEANTKETYLQSTLDIPVKRKTIQSDSITYTSITLLKECESSKEAITTMNIESQRILHEHMKSRYFAQGDQVKLLLPNLSNKLFYQWQGPFTITRKISNLLYEINVNKVTKVFHVHMFENYHNQIMKTSKQKLNILQAQQLSLKKKKKRHQHPFLR
uniref:Integrase zinc-binding domain-containing protein n=1 Tax=Biomphalaria glabrata TaxID=6526 RepID=A0A2C9KSQ3_BIOGL